MVAQLDSLYIQTRPLKALSRLISYALFEGRPLTTKGQWINPLVFGLFALEKRLPQLKPVEKPIFILGTGRSGTTVLGMILSMHREVGFLNEPKALWHSIYPHEDVIGNYSRGFANYRLKSEDANEEVRTTAHRLLGAYLTVVGCQRVVDKYPELIFRIPFVRAIFPDARFILIVRNGWDTCQSIEGWSQRLGVEANNEIHDWWGVNNRKWHLLVKQLVDSDPYFQGIRREIINLDRHIDMAVVEWIVTMREGLRLREKFPNLVHPVQYEKLVSTPEQTLAKVLEFCELSPDAKLFDYAAQILSLPPSKPAFHLDPQLRALFEETMIALGYG
jgi:hypothetical protein